MREQKELSRQVGALVSRLPRGRSMTWDAARVLQHGWRVFAECHLVALACGRLRQPQRRCTQKGEPMHGRFCAASILAIGLLASGAACAQQSDWDKVVAAAKKEGSVTVYHAQLGAPHFVTAVKNFQDRYGIKVDQLDVRSSELTERVRTEQTSGRYLGDVQFRGDATLENDYKQGFVQKIGDIPNAKNLREPFHATEFGVPLWAQHIGFLINTNMIKPADAPKSWHDLLDPKWRGKILADDPRPSGSGQTVFYVTYKKFGPQFQEQMAQQNLVLSRDLRQDARRVARGEYPIYMAQLFVFASDLKGLPVKAVVPEEGAPYTLIMGGILRGAPHPNAARVFMNFILEPDTQALYANAWYVPVTKGTIEKLTDPDSKLYASAKLLGTTETNDRQQMMDLATKIYSK
jgi:iron(III) transport system substrate-binding protein